MHVQEIEVIDDPRGALDQIFGTLRHLCANTTDLILQPPTGSELVTLCDNWDEILRHVDVDFRRIYSISPRKFEELIAEMLVRDNFRVELTKQTRDGGFDILAYQDSPLGGHLRLVECKRLAISNTVGVPLVSALYGVLDHKDATSAAFVTTSEFTRDARKFESAHPHRLRLRNHEFLRDRIKRIRGS